MNIEQLRNSRKNSFSYLSQWDAAVPHCTPSCSNSLLFLKWQTKSYISRSRGSPQRANCVAEKGERTAGTLQDHRRAETWSPGQSQRKHSVGTGGCPADRSGDPLCLYFLLFPFCPFTSDQAFPSTYWQAFTSCHPLKGVSVPTHFMQALLREKQKAEELQKMKETIKKLIQDASVRTRVQVNTGPFQQKLVPWKMYEISQHDK